MEDKELKKLAKDIFEKIKKKYYEIAKEMIVADASVSALKEIKITDSKIEGIPYIPKGRKIFLNFTKMLKILKFLNLEYM